jgi:trans-aconitate 2-methyltransferase
MIQGARAYLLPEFDGRVTFVHTDLLKLSLFDVADVVFSTATFHWVLDHAALFRVLLRALKPSGNLVSQCGGESNLARLLERAKKIENTVEFRPYFQEWEGPWHFASPDLTIARMTDAGFVDVHADLEYAPTILENPDEFAEFVRTVILRLHLERLPDERLRSRLLELLTNQAAGDDPPFLLDYWRLNVQGRKPPTSEHRGIA